MLPVAVAASASSAPSGRLVSVAVADAMVGPVPPVIVNWFEAAATGPALGVKVVVKLAPPAPFRLSTAAGRPTKLLKLLIFQPPRPSVPASRTLSVAL